jgi:hypothetical protein
LIDADLVAAGCLFAAAFAVDQGDAYRVLDQKLPGSSSVDTPGTIAALGSMAQKLP